MKKLFSEYSLILSNQKKDRKIAKTKFKNEDAAKYEIQKMNENPKKYKDFVYYAKNDNIYMYSDLRGITFIFTDIYWLKKNSPDEAKKLWVSIWDVIISTDERYIVNKSEDVNPELYICLFSEEYNKVMLDKENKKMLKLKHEFKHIAKKAVKYKYRIGDRYSIRKKNIDSVDIGNEVFEVKKFIYTIGANIVNIVIMKQVSGDLYNDKQLTTFDCKAFHLKYEHGLYVFPMNMSLLKIK